MLEKEAALSKNEWLETLLPKIDGLRAELKGITGEELSVKSGAGLDASGLTLSLLFDDYRIDTGTFQIGRVGKGEMDPFHEAIILEYLKRSDGTLPSGKWINFRELPGGGNYFQAFQGYGPDTLVKKWVFDVEGFDAACKKNGGTKVDMGDAGYEFLVLPRLKVALVYWLGDEDFPSSASVLFDANASRLMVTDGLAILAKHLVNHIVKNG